MNKSSKHDEDLLKPFVARKLENLSLPDTKVVVVEFLIGVIIIKQRSDVSHPLPSPPPTHPTGYPIKGQQQSTFSSLFMITKEGGGEANNTHVRTRARTHRCKKKAE